MSGGITALVLIPFSFTDTDNRSEAFRRESSGMSLR